MRRIVGISGGDLRTTDSLNKYAIELTGKNNPNVLFVPTASEDAEGYIENIRKYYEGLHCKLEVLYLCHHADSDECVQEKIRCADLIYVGGGDTEAMLAVWKKRNIDKLLLAACEEGAVLTGISAGMICWFAYGYSDSDYFKNPDNWTYKFVEGLGAYQLMVCPHYNEEGRRSFDDMLVKANLAMDGLALENDVAVVLEGDKLSVIKADNQRHAYYFKYGEGRYSKTEITEGKSRKWI